MRMRRALSGALSAAVVVGATLALGAAPAQAGKPLDHGTYHDVGSHSSAVDKEWPCKTLGFDVIIAEDVHGSFRFGPRRPGGVNYGQEGSHGWNSFSANGNTYKGVFDVLNKDMTVTENEDGSLTIITVGTGTEKWFVNGTLMFHNPGQTRIELLVTNPGQPNEEVKFVRVVRESTGLNNGPTRSFCEDIADFRAPSP